MRRRALRIASAIAVGALALAPAAIAGAERQRYTYTFHGEHADSFPEPIGFCSGPATVTVDQDYTLHVTATEAGLTEGDIWALLEAEDETVLRTVAFSGHGTATVAEAGGDTYDATFGEHWGGVVRGPGDAIYRFTFRAKGTNQDGETVTLHEVGHVRFVDGELVREVERARNHGCD